MGNYINYGNIVPGWDLIRAIKGGNGLDPGQWGLVFSEFFFKRKDFGVSFVFDEIPPDIDFENDDMFDEYIRMIEDFEENLKTDPQIGFAFYSSCLESDFDPEEDDFHVFVAGRMKIVAREGQAKIKDADLKKMMNIFVAVENYEKAAIIRDLLEKKITDKIF